MIVGAHDAQEQLQLRHLLTFHLRRQAVQVLGEHLGHTGQLAYGALLIAGFEAVVDDLALVDERAIIVAYLFDQLSVEAVGGAVVGVRGVDDRQLLTQLHVDFGRDPLEEAHGFLGRANVGVGAHHVVLCLAAQVEGRRVAQPLRFACPLHRVVEAVHRLGLVAQVEPAPARLVNPVPQHVGLPELFHLGVEGQRLLKVVFAEEVVADIQVSVRNEIARRTLQHQLSVIAIPGIALTHQRGVVPDRVQNLIQVFVVGVVLLDLLVGLDGLPPPRGLRGYEALLLHFGRLQGLHVLLLFRLEDRLQQLVALRFVEEVLGLLPILVGQLHQRFGVLRVAGVLDLEDLKQRLDRRLTLGRSRLVALGPSRIQRELGALDLVPLLLVGLVLFENLHARQVGIALRRGLLDGRLLPLLGDRHVYTHKAQRQRARQRQTENPALKNVVHHDPSPRLTCLRAASAH